MPIFTLTDLRNSAPAEYRNLPDTELVSLYSERVGMDPMHVASQLGMDVGGKWGNRLSSAVDNYQAGLYGVAEAMGSKWAGEQRRSNERQADFADAVVRKRGGVSSYKDVNGFGDAADYVGGLAVQSVPYLAEAAIGGIAARGLSGGLRAAAMAGDKAAQEALATRSAIGGAAASYPSSVGDVLGNQRDQLRENGYSESQTDFGSALAGGLPYAALNYFSPAERLASQGGIRRIVSAADDVKGVKGGALRTAGNATVAGAFEGANELGQEFVNQGFGRMAVDPNETFFNDKSNERFKESFIGGAALGGVMGGAAGGWRRSSGYVDPRSTSVESGQTTDLTNNTLSLGFSGYDTGVGELVTGPDGTTMTRAEYEARRSGKYVPATIGERSLSRVDSPIYEQEQGPNFNFGGDQPLLGAPSRTTKEQSNPGVLSVTSSGTVAPIEQLSGQQYDLLGGQDTFGDTGNSVEALRDQTIGNPMAPGSVAVPDNRTRDMLFENPTALAPTANNPLTEPNSYGQVMYPATTSAKQTPRPSVGPTVGMIRSQIAQRVGASDAYSTKLAVDLSRIGGDIQQATAYLAQEHATQQKELDKLDRKVSMGSDMLTPEEYQQKRDAIEKRQMAIMAAEDLFQVQARQATAAMAEEGVSKAKAGGTPGPVKGGRATENTMREQNMAGEVAKVDQQLADRRTADTQKERMGILRKVLGDKTRGSPMARFRQALRKAGFTNMDITPAEQDEIHRVTERKSDVRAATVVPPGLAAKNGKLTSRASLEEKTDVQPAARTPAKPAEPPAVAKPAAKAEPSKPKAAPANKKSAPVTETTSAAPASVKLASKPATPATPAVEKQQATVGTDDLVPVRKKLKKLQDFADSLQQVLVCLSKAQ